MCDSYLKKNSSKRDVVYIQKESNHSGVRRAADDDHNIFFTAYSSSPQLNAQLQLQLVH